MDKVIEEQVEGRRDLIKAIFLCTFAVVFVRSFLFEPFTIPSSSMVPTLRIGDYIFVSKFSFGLTVPLTKWDLVRWKTPARGDVIVFWYPRDESLHYIKRVVGIPGDKVEFKGKELWINGVLVPKEKISDRAEIERVTGNLDFTGELYKETIGEDTHYVRYTQSLSYEVSRNFKVDEVPADRFFVAGDNRDDSSDSRSWGFVPRENIRGRAQMIWLSLDREQNWGQWSKIRWSRIGQTIH